MEKLKIGSDCSGVGAFNQALKRLGVEYKEQFACDLDRFARQTFIHNYGTKKDVEILNTAECKRIDAVYMKSYDKKKSKTISEEDWKFVRENEERIARSFSFYYPWDMNYRSIPSEHSDWYISTVPCQSFSISGLRLGEKDKRGILFYSSHKYIKKNKPRFFIFENVKGLLSDSKEKGNEFGTTFNNWLSLLGGKSINGKISMFVHEDAVPYHIYWKVVNAKDRGVPQNRERVFIVGIRDDADNTFAWPEKIELKKKLKDVLESNVDEKYFLSDKMIKHLLQHDRAQKFIEEEESHVNTITANYAKQSSDLQYLKVKPEEEGLIQLNNPKHSTNRVFDPKGISHGLTTMTGGGRQPYVKVDNEEPIVIQKGRGFNKGGCHIESPPITSNSFQNNNHLCIPVLTPNRPEKRQNGRRFKEDGEPSFTLTAQDKHGVFDGVKIRRLTERECFRLMDFPDTFTWPVSSSQAYKQAGNSVVVQMYVDILEQFI